MPAYQQTGGGDIGTLLRMIQEEKSSAVLNAPPAAEPGSPIRELTQGPILTPEDPTSTRISSQAAEGVNSGVVSPVSPAIQNAGLVPGPNTNVGSMPRVTGPSAPVAPQRPASASVGNSIPTGTLLNNAPRSSAPAKSPAIGTTIKATPASYKPAPSKPANQPSTSKVGNLIATALKPTVTKEFVGANKGQNILDKAINAILKKTPGNVIQNVKPKWFA